MSDRRADALRGAATARSQDAEERARRAIRELHGRGVEVNFATVAHTANVGPDFLYRHTQLRAAIEQLRGNQQRAPSRLPVHEQASENSTRAGVMTGFIAFGILELRVRGFRRFELAIAGLLGIIFLGFIYETLKIGPSASGVAGGLIPNLNGTESVYLAVGIIGATVMPHAIYLHSALTQGRMPCRDDRERARVLRFERTDVIIALGLAGLINISMLAVAAQLFHQSGDSGIDTIQAAHAGFAHLVGGGAALAFAAALLASGASSSSVGTYAGQVVMAGFVNIRISLYVRRIVTMLPRTRGPRGRHEPHQRARPQPSRPLLRHPLRADPARDAHQPPRRDGHPRQPPPHHQHRLGHGSHHHRAQPVPALPAILHLETGRARLCTRHPAPTPRSQALASRRHTNLDIRRDEQRREHTRRVKRGHDDPDLAATLCARDRR